MISKVAAGTAPGSALIALAATVLFASPVAAANGDRVVREEFGPFEILGQVAADCGDFTVLADTVYRGHATLRFDAAGNLLQISAHERFTEVLYNSNDPTKYLSSNPQQASNLLVNIENSTEWVAGSIFKFTLPGVGVVLHDVGRLVYDTNTGEVLFQAGPQQYLNGDIAALCAALS
jgi:hypothetical protein